MDRRQRDRDRDRVVRRRAVCAALAAVLLIGLAAAAPQCVRADAASDACSYYSAYADSVIFEPNSRQGGYIYYATKANLSTNQVRFRTLGWKMTIVNGSGKRLQTLYYKLDGSYMSRIHTKTRSGYEYNLYRMHLDMLRNRLNTKAAGAFYGGECRLILDACMTTVVNGLPQGSMTDDGAMSGKVYTDYSGINGAAGWSDAARQSLKSYFNKEIAGLFHRLTVKKNAGIKEVSGGGFYCYGTRVTVDAKVKKGYVFAGWKGLEQAKGLQHTFFINRGGTMTATADPLSLTVVLHRNKSSGDQTTKEIKVTYGKGEKKLSAGSWKKDGKAPRGWALAQGAAQPNYALNVRVDNGWIEKYAPKVHLYAVWGQKTTGGGGGTTENTPDPYVPSPPDPSPFAPFPEQPDPNPFAPSPEPWQEEPEEVPEPVLTFQVRFISRAYFEDAWGNLIPEQQGGLAADSRWTEDGLRDLLRAVLW